MPASFFCPGSRAEAGAGELFRSFRQKRSVPFERSASHSGESFQGEIPFAGNHRMLSAAWLL